MIYYTFFFNINISFLIVLFQMLHFLHKQGIKINMNHQKM